MVEMKLTPDDIALTTPAYYTTDRKALLEQREKCIEDLIANANKCQWANEKLHSKRKKPNTFSFISSLNNLFVKENLIERVLLQHWLK